jgi:replicative DNA helicase
LIVIGGRPAMGVTQLLINLAISFSEEESVFYFMPNRSQSRIIDRITSSLTKIPIGKIVRNQLTVNDTVTLAALQLNRPFNNIHIHDSGINTWDGYIDEQIVFLEYVQALL